MVDLAIEHGDSPNFTFVYQRVMGIIWMCWIINTCSQDLQVKNLRLLSIGIQMFSYFHVFYWTHLDTHLQMGSKTIWLLTQTNRVFLVLFSSPHGLQTSQKRSCRWSADWPGPADPVCCDWSPPISNGNSQWFTSTWILRPCWREWFP